MRRVGDEIRAYFQVSRERLDVGDRKWAVIAVAVAAAAVVWQSRRQVTEKANSIGCGKSSRKEAGLSADPSTAWPYTKKDQPDARGVGGHIP